MSGIPPFPEPLNPPRESAPKEQPKGRRDTAPKPAQPQTGRKAPLEKRLHETISSIGVGVVLINEIDGLAILEGSERLAQSLDKAAQQSPRVRAALEAALTGGVWAEVTFAVGAIILPIALNHGMIPAGVGGFIKLPESSANGNGPAG